MYAQQRKHSAAPRAYTFVYVELRGRIICSILRFEIVVLVDME